MAYVDEIYNGVIADILENGVSNTPEQARPKYEDGTPATAKSVLNVQLKFDNSKEPLLLTSKQTPRVDPIHELFWIWKEMSNRVKDLQDAGCKVWDEWERADGTIGKAYGWQLKNKKRKVIVDYLFLNMLGNNEFSVSAEDLELDVETEEGLLGTEVLVNQVDFLLYSLKNNPYSNRIKTTLYCVEDLDDMALEPCVYETQWQSWDGKLYLTVGIRSNDMALGNPYNIYQYSVLHRLIAQVSGLEVGGICFNIFNAHVYERHIEAITEQIQQPVHDAPDMWINPEITSFYDFTFADIKITNYKHSGKVYYEIAI